MVSEKEIQDLYVKTLSQHVSYPVKKPETPEEAAEASAYLIRMGVLPPTPENFSLLGDNEVYLEADELPADLKSEGEKHIRNRELDWSTDEEFTDEIFDATIRLEGVWIKEGKISGVKRAYQAKVTYVEFTGID